MFNYSHNAFVVLSFVQIQMTNYIKYNLQSQYGIKTYFLKGLKGFPAFKDHKVPLKHDNIYHSASHKSLITHLNMTRLTRSSSMTLALKP